MRIEEIDSNLKVKTSLSEEGIRFLDVRSEPFEIYGLYEPRTQNVFRRMPQAVADSVNDGVSQLSRHTAGGRVRFSTDSTYVAIKAEMQSVTHFPHMPLTGTSGFDMYVDSGTQSTYYGTFVPPYDMKSGYESILRFPTKRMRSITINFPLYNNVTELFIGLDERSAVGAGESYIPGAPVVYYGSSITQGGCASRPGNAYQSIISRRFNRDYINLGFSGSARGELEIAEYIAGLDMSAFVCDYDHNAPDAEHLSRTYLPFIELFRQKYPTVPVILVSRPNYNLDNAQGIKRRSIIMDAYLELKSRGDGNIWFVDGSALFGGEDRDACTVDNCHPNDLGFARMADVIGKSVEYALSLKEESR